MCDTRKSGSRAALPSLPGLLSLAGSPQRRGGLAGFGKAIWSNEQIRLVAAWLPGQHPRG